ncbi:MAG: AIR synthase related protein, partial [Fidelibacterota bacterium]
DVHKLDINSFPDVDNYNEVLLKLLSSPAIASKRWVYEQYDTMVRTNTVIPPGADAAVIRIKETPGALALKTDGNGRYSYLNPRKGGIIAVVEAARNIVCVGAKPLAITNCLNFGNPEDPEIFWQFKEVVSGIGEACKVLETPVTGGNVSFYNEGISGAVFPTPVIGMVGFLENVANVMTPGFKDEGDFIILLGTIKGDLGGSEYLKQIHNVIRGDAPDIDIFFEKRIQDACLEAIERGILKSAHDISDGGLAVALAECCISGEKPVGANIIINRKMRNDELLFGESQSVIIISVSEGDLIYFEEIAAKYHVPSEAIGRVRGDRLKINRRIDLKLEKIIDAYENSILNYMKHY